MATLPLPRTRLLETSLFVGLSYAFAWLLSSVLLWDQIRTALATGLTTTSSPPQLLGVVMFIPMAAAICARLATGHSLRGTFGLSRPLVQYFAAVAIPGLLFALFLLVVVASGWGTWIRQTKAPLVVAYPLSLLVGAAIGAVFGMGEEYGWRGLLLRNLLSLGEARASVVTGVVWALWHVPGLVAGLNFPGSNPWVAVLVFTTSMVVMSYVYTLFFVATRGSAFLCGVFHAASNVAVDGFTGSSSVAGNPFITNGTGLR